MKGRIVSLLQTCALAFVQFALGGLILSAGVFAVSFFQSGARAEYTRAVSLGPLLVLSVVGFLKAIWIFVAALLRARE